MCLQAMFMTKSISGVSVGAVTAMEAQIKGDAIRRMSVNNESNLTC
jgi:hypothetical protein